MKGWEGRGRWPGRESRDGCGGKVNLRFITCRLYMMIKMADF